MTLRGIVVDSGPRLAMGCDGGTIPKRHELVKGPKKVEKVSDRARWGLGGSQGASSRGGGASGFPDAAALWEPSRRAQKEQECKQRAFGARWLLPSTRQHP